MRERRRLLDDVESYYTQKFATHGATARGVDWNGELSQEIRFRELLRLHRSTEPFSVNDYGCGYAALVDFLDRHYGTFVYRGFDLSLPMLAHARATYAGRETVVFVDVEDELPPADYTVASGIFNVRLDSNPDEWKRYILDTLDRMSSLSERGFAFNMLTSYSEPEKMRDDLFYGDPAYFFAHCRQNYSHNVALLHDYGLWEFTILVRREL
jgi:SAM-dependent methyltransferase